MMSRVLDLFGIHIGIEGFVVLERYYESVLRMTGQTGLCLVRRARILGCRGTAKEQGYGKQHHPERNYVVSFLHRYSHLHRIRRFEPSGQTVEALRARVYVKLVPWQTANSG